jgi:integrase
MWEAGGGRGHSVHFTISEFLGALAFSVSGYAIVFICRRPVFKPDNAPPFLPQMSLRDACQEYLERRANKLRPRSLEQYCYYFRTLRKFFDPNLQLSAFHEQHFRDYQKWRIQQKAGPSVINHELNALSQILALADLWHPISRYYEGLPQKNWVPPRIMTAEEEERFIRFGRRKPEWRTALNSALMSGNTTLLGCEIRTLRLEHLCLAQKPPIIRLPETVKNTHRTRSVPLNEIALEAVRDLVALAKERGSCESQHYLIAFRIRLGKYDPNRPASSCFIRTAFHSIARASGLAWVTPKTFRHQAVTKLLESGASDETVRSIAGHVTKKALEYYSHIRIEAKQAAVDRLMPSARAKPAKPVAHPDTLPLLGKVKATAERLGIDAEAAVELVLTYERGKHA